MDGRRLRCSKRSELELTAAGDKYVDESGSLVRSRRR